MSTVDGHPITVSDIEVLARAGLPRREALRRLQGERLLMSEAERRGMSSRASVALVAREALVQALLDAEAGAVVVSAAEIKQAYDKDKTRFEQPERRSCVHVLAKLPKQPSPEADAAAKAFAERMIVELSQAADPAAFVAQQRGRGTDLFGVVAESIPPTDAKGNLVKPFMDAMFSLEKPGMVAQPVRTIYGWHAVRLTAIQPAELTPYAKAAETLRGELVLSRKKERVQQLIERLRGQYGITIAKDIGQTLARLEL